MPRPVGMWSLPGAWSPAFAPGVSRDAEPFPAQILPRALSCAVLLLLVAAVLSRGKRCSIAKILRQYRAVIFHEIQNLKNLSGSADRNSRAGPACRSDKDQKILLSIYNISMSLRDVAAGTLRGPEEVAVWKVARNTEVVLRDCRKICKVGAPAPSQAPQWLPVSQPGCGQSLPCCTRSPGCRLGAFRLFSPRRRGGGEGLRRLYGGGVAKAHPGELYTARPWPWGAKSGGASAGRAGGFLPVCRLPLGRDAAAGGDVEPPWVSEHSRVGSPRMLSGKSRERKQLKEIARKAERLSTCWEKLYALRSPGRDS
nr:PREDICTED: uncharacterized protein LOC106490951 [Apteryx mantelli mantelli]